MNRWTLAFIAILIFGSSWLWVSRPALMAQANSNNPQPAIGYPAPDFSLVTLDGESFALADQRGTPVVLNFWATWCGPCQNELPALQATAERYAGKVIIVGVDQAEAPEVVRAYVDKLGLTFPTPLDTDNAVAHRYNVTGMPTTFFIDADGVIRHFWMGEMNRITLAEGIGKILP